jgi:hypothetical protein
VWWLHHRITWFACLQDCWLTTTANIATNILFHTHYMSQTYYNQLYKYTLSHSLSQSLYLSLRETTVTLFYTSRDPSQLVKLVYYWHVSLRRGNTEWLDPSCANTIITVVYDQTITDPSQDQLLVPLIPHDVVLFWSDLSWRIGSHN